MGVPLIFWKHPILWMIFFKMYICGMKQKSPHFFTGISTLWAKSKVGISAVENSAAGGNVRTQLVELV